MARPERQQGKLLQNARWISVAVPVSSGNWIAIACKYTRHWYYHVILLTHKLYIVPTSRRKSTIDGKQLSRDQFQGTRNDILPKFLFSWLTRKYGKNITVPALSLEPIYIVSCIFTFLPCDVTRYIGNYFHTVIPQVFGGGVTYTPVHLVVPRSIQLRTYRRSCSTPSL